MRWRYIASKVVGTSHIANSEPCQDHFEVGNIGSRDEVFFAFVSDGAGSAICGGRGAEITCKAASQFLANLSLEQCCNVQETQILEIFDAIVSSIDITAKEEKLLPKDFACTFLGVILSESGSAFIQIGDGAIVTKFDGRENFDTVFWPDNGEYANTTCFVSDDNALASLKWKCISYIPDQIAVFTDGLQRLCLRFSDQKVHDPFFEPMFKMIANCPNENELGKLNSELERFLNSNPVNERTDDDKTLVLAVRENNEY